MRGKSGEGASVAVSMVISLLIVFFIVIPSINTFWQGYQFDRNVGSYCELAYEASDISKKVQYFDTCVDLMKKEQLTGYSVWWFKTPSDKVSEHYAVMESLQTRMHQLVGMERDSFEYQKGLEQVEDELGYFVGAEEYFGSTLSKFKTAYCFEKSWKYWCWG